MSRYFCHALRPPGYDRDFIGVQYGRPGRFRKGRIGWPRFFATHPDLIDGCVEVFTGIVDRPTAVSGSASGTTAAHSEKDTLGSRLERNLAESAYWILPQRDHRR